MSDAFLRPGNTLLGLGEGSRHHWRTLRKSQSTYELLTIPPSTLDGCRGSVIQARSVTCYYGNNDVFEVTAYTNVHTTSLWGLSVTCS